jgi:hypothetical protein
MDGDGGFVYNKLSDRRKKKKKRSPGQEAALGGADAGDLSA